MELGDNKIAATINKSVLTMDEAVAYSLQASRQEPTRIDFSRYEDGIGEKIGANLRNYRQSFNYTQQQHADIMGVSLSQYRKYESGVDILRYHTSCRWTISTGASLYQLLLNTPYEAILPEYLTSWKLMPFSNLIGRLNDRAYLGLVSLVQSLQFTREIVIPQHLESDLNSIDIQKTYQELETSTYLVTALNLRLFREMRGLSQEQMAELLGLNTNTYRNYENAKTAPKYSMLFGIRFFLVFNQHLLSLIPNSLFSQYLSQYLRRLSYLAPTLHKINDDQYQQMQTLFAQIEAIADNNGAYIF